MLRRAALCVALLAGACLGAGRVVADGPRLTTWEAPARITQFKRADATGDGVTDVLIASGREVFVWAGADGALPGARARFVVTLPDDANFADAADRGRPALRVIGRGRVFEVNLATGATSDEQPMPVVGFRDRDKVTFLDLTLPGRGALAPTPDGWRFDRSDLPSIQIELGADQWVTEGGPFLEDTAAVTIGLPAATVARSPFADSDALALWGLSDGRLLANEARGRVAYDLSFLGRDGERRLVDLDGDGRPDVFYRSTTNREGRYAFFHTGAVPAPKPGAGQPTEGPTLLPARAHLSLSGFQLDPELVDLDGDGLPDFVVTTIEIDAKNTLRALASGTVTARTQAFLNRSRDGGRSFPEEPDATVLSDVGVQLRFTYAGTIEVKRALSIVVDGDFDGDGRLDLAIRTGPETLHVRRGVVSGVWEAQGRDVPIPALGTHANVEAYAVDTNGDERDELLLIYRSEGAEPERIVHLAP